MTAINIAIQADRIHMFTDGAFRAPDGTLEHVAGKVWLWPHVPAAVACRGGDGVLSCVGHYLRNVVDFDALVAGIGQATALVDVELKKLRQQDSRVSEFEVFAAGYSPALGRLAAYLVPGHEGYGNAAAPFRPTEMTPAVHAAPPPSEAACDALGWAVPEVDAFDPERDGVTLMRAQRRTYPGHIGGFCQLVTITRGTIETRVLHRWPDVVGRRFDGRTP